MTEEQTTTSATAIPEAPEGDDPRVAFAKVTEALGNLIASTATDGETLALPTPCPEFTVKELLEHIVLVMRRVAVVGRGEHWSTVTEVPTDSGWADDYRAAAHDVMAAWTDPGTLDQVLEVPWGEFPGAILMYNYTGELAVHAWDLATATGVELAIDDEVLHGALIAAKFLPAEGRNTPDLPFSEVVDPGADAPVLDQLAGWLGRDVLA